jgi:2-dehydropantoate 2-reductase
MKITIIGSGGVGGYFGARLAQAGNDICFVARGAHLEAMQTRGLMLKSILGDVQIGRARFVSTLAESGPADLILVAVKAWQVAELAPQIAGLLGAGTLVLPLQNGVLATEELTAALPAEQVLSGLCRIISYVEAPGVIRHTAVEPSIVYGFRDPALNVKAAPLKTLFEQAGIKARCSADIEADLWKKFIAICVSGYLALTRSTYGELRSCKETRATMQALFEEVAMVGRRSGVVIEEDFVARTMAVIDTFPPETTASLTRDIWEGKPSELDYQNGAVVRLADKLGVDVPVNRFIYHSLLLMERRARKGL